MSYIIAIKIASTFNKKPDELFYDNFKKHKLKLKKQQLKIIVVNPLTIEQKISKIQEIEEILTNLNK